MSATGFFHDAGSTRDRTIVRDEPLAGIDAPDCVHDAKFLTVFEPGTTTVWITARRDHVVELTEVR